MSSLFKVQPISLSTANAGISWEVVEMQNLGDINPHLLQYVLWFCSIYPLTSLKLSTFNRSGSPSSMACSLSDMQIVAGIPGDWGVLEVRSVRD